MSRHLFLRARRLALWNENPRCRRCGIITILPTEISNGILPHNAATVQHISGKLKCLGLIKYDSDDNTTLYCYHCNNLDGTKEFISLSTEQHYEIMTKHTTFSKLRIRFDLHFH